MEAHTTQTTPEKGACTGRVFPVSWPRRLGCTVGRILTSVCPCLLPLVDWSNAVDATYRGELRELNELNARIDRIVDEVDASLERGLKKQTRWMLLAWGTVLAGVIGLLARG